MSLIVNASGQHVFWSPTQELGIMAFGNDASGQHLLWNPTQELERTTLSVNASDQHLLWYPDGSQCHRLLSTPALEYS